MVIHGGIMFTKLNQQHRRFSVRLEGDFIFLQLNGQRPLGQHPAKKQFVHQISPQNTVIGFAIIQQQMISIMGFPFIFQRFNRTGYAFDKLIITYRLQNIIKCLQLNSFFRILKIGITRQ
ncbi:hypothetical protein D3C75_456890 [compost metagenome]